MASAPASWPPLRVQVKAPSGAETSTWSVAKNGRKKPRYCPKPTARAAMPPVMITRKQAHPKRKPQNGP
jgi:hypothetical protein